MNSRERNKTCVKSEWGISLCYACESLSWHHCQAQECVFLPLPCCLLPKGTLILPSTSETSLTALYLPWPSSLGFPLVFWQHILHLFWWQNILQKKNLIKAKANNCQDVHATTHINVFEHIALSFLFPYRSLFLSYFVFHDCKILERKNNWVAIFCFLLFFWVFF